MKNGEEGQVGVIVAMLLVSLIAIIIIIIQVEYVPNWMNDKEAEHMELVQNQFAFLKSNIDIQSIDKSIDHPLTAAIKLGGERLPFFATSRTFGIFDIFSSEHSKFYVEVTSPNGTIEQEFNEQHITNTTIDTITEITFFELLIPTASPSNSERFTISINLNDYEEIGNITIEVTSGTIILTTRDNGEKIYGQPIAMGLSNSSYRINLLNPDYKLYKIIGANANTYNLASTVPININLTLNGTATFFISGKKFIISDFPQTYNMGTMKYSANSAYFPDHSFSLESGAVILNQSEGHTMVFPPSLTIQNSNISILLIDIDVAGERDTISGFGTYSIKTIFSSSTHICFRAAEINLSIFTSYHDAWFRYLNSTYYLSTGYLNTSIIQSPESVTLNVKANRNNVQLIITNVKIFAQIEYT